MRNLILCATVSLSVLVSSELLAISYDCFVSEETTENSIPIGTLKLDSQSEDVSFVAIDKFLFAACRGGLKEASTTFLTCGFIIENPENVDSNPLAQMRAMTDVRSAALAQDLRSVTILPETVGFFIHGFKRNARLFQLGCQVSG